jgi:hypothetical protein
MPPHSYPGADKYIQAQADRNLACLVLAYGEDIEINSLRSITLACSMLNSRIWAGKVVIEDYDVDFKTFDSLGKFNFASADVCGGLILSTFC